MTTAAGEVGTCDGCERPGFEAAGWDPHHAPLTPQVAAEVVNLGYVINVIENPAERADTLRSAWDLAGELLIVSARLRDELARLSGAASEEGDGTRTATGTFQKFYTQVEFREWVDDTLPDDAPPAVPIRSRGAAGLSRSGSTAGLYRIPIRATSSRAAGQGQRPNVRGAQGCAGPSHRLRRRPWTSPGRYGSNGLRRR